MCRIIFLTGPIVLLAPSVVWADGERAEPGTWWRAWDGDPLVLTSCGLLAWLYCRGIARLWRRTGKGRKIGRWNAVSFMGSLLVIMFALLSPLDALSDELSSVHMVQHMTLTMVAAPLFIIGSPLLAVSWGMAELWNGKSREVWQSTFRLLNCIYLWHPLFIWTLFLATLWISHHPTIYQAALRDPLVHDAQHLGAFVVSCLFWRLVIGPQSERRLSGLAVIPYLFTTCVHASALGLFLALAPRVCYDHYLFRTTIWGLTPLEDQQLAGFIMWMPACLIYPAISATRFGMWLRNYEFPIRGLCLPHAARPKDLRP